jgi:deazaflavin-dependent oxidoreductase (nitroreductase family)
VIRVLLVSSTCVGLEVDATRLGRAIGRNSGDPRSTPVDLITLNGSLHVVGICCARGWVHNLRAQPRCRVRSRGGETSYTAVELPVTEAAPVLPEQLRTSRCVRDHQDVGTDDSDAAMVAAAADRPVFRLDPATS